MKKTILTLFAISAAMVASMAASYLGPVNITCDGLARKYIYYLPETAQDGDNLPLVILLHGIGGYNTSFYTSEAKGMANTYHCAVMVPQALPEQDQTLLALLNVANPNFANELKKSAWGANAYIRISDLDANTQALIQQYAPTYYNAGKIQINKNVNDAKFIREAFNNLSYTLKNEKGLNIDNQQVYVTGLSLGGAMSYNYAFSSYGNVKKLVSLSGFLSKGVSVPKGYNLPTLVFHSKTDDVVTYTGGLINRPIEDIVNEIAAANTHSEPEVTTLNQNKVTLTEWKESPTVTFYSISNASHVLEGNHGLKIFNIIGDFLFDTDVSTKESVTTSVSIYPNPVADALNIASDAEFTSAMVTSLAGRTFRLAVNNNTVNVSSLAKGIYIIDLISRDGATEKCKFIKK